MSERGPLSFIREIGESEPQMGKAPPNPERGLLVLPVELDQGPLSATNEAAQAEEPEPEQSKA